MTKEIFAKNIYNLRKAKKWSQEKLADEAKVSTQTIFRAEAGTIPRTDNLHRIANALETTVTALLGEVAIKPPPELGPQTIRAIQETIREAVAEALAEKAAEKEKPTTETDRDAVVRLLDMYNDRAVEKYEESRVFKLLRYFLEDRPQDILDRLNLEDLLDHPPAESTQPKLEANHKTTESHSVSEKKRQAR